jgi:hypothetical protein
MNNKELARLRELAGITHEPVTPKTKRQLDEGVIGAMHTINHVSVRENDYSEGEYNEASMDEGDYNEGDYNEGDYNEASMSEGQEGIVMTKVGSGHKITANDILQDIKAGYDDALYFATEEQVSKLIDAGKISEDYFSHWQSAQEEMAHLKHDAEQEFGSIRENDLEWNDYFDNDREAGGSSESYETPDEYQARVARVKAYLASQDTSSKEVEEANYGMGESDMDQFTNTVDEDMLTSKEDKIVNDCRAMVASGMDPEQVVMSMADEYRLSNEEQFDLFDMITKEPVPEASSKPDYIDLDNDGDKEESMKKAAMDKDQVAEEDSGMTQDARDALDDALDRRVSMPPVPDGRYPPKDDMEEASQYRPDGKSSSFNDDYVDDTDKWQASIHDVADNIVKVLTKAGVSDIDGGLDILDNLEELNSIWTEVYDYHPQQDELYNMIKAKVDGRVSEDFDNGYDKQIEVDANGYFPDGAHNAVSKKAGPASANQGDNPLQKGMMESRSIHTSLVSGYRQFKK